MFMTGEAVGAPCHAGRDYAERDRDVSCWTRGCCGASALFSLLQAAERSASVFWLASVYVYVYDSLMLMRSVCKL